MNRWITLYQRLPGLFTFVMGALIGLTLTTLVFDQRHHRLEQRYSQYYGKALANMAAHQAVDASLNHDLISLQVILQDVVDNPRMAFATIHDVENNLLVQAGDSNTARNHGLATRSYSAPIVFHDSVAGYVTVSMYAGAEDRPVVLTTVAVITLLLAGIAILAWYDGTRSEGDETRTSDSHVAAEDLVSANSELPPELALNSVAQQAFAYIYIHNYKILEQQLSSSKFSEILQQFEQSAREVLTLYNGSEVKASNQGWRLGFPCGETAAKAIFNAACSAFLLLKIASSTSSVPLELSGIIAASDIEPRPTQGLIGGKSSSPSGLFLDATLLNISLEASGLTLADGDAQIGEMIAIIGFQQPYASLLENQCQQLLS